MEGLRGEQLEHSACGTLRLAFLGWARLSAVAGFLSFRLDFGLDFALISAGFWLRLDLALILALI